MIWQFVDVHRQPTYALGIDQKSVNVPSAQPTIGNLLSITTKNAAADSRKHPAFAKEFLFIIFILSLPKINAPIYNRVFFLLVDVGGVVLCVYGCE